MFGYKKGAPANGSKGNPFDDSDDESDAKPTRNAAKRTSSEPGQLKQQANGDPDALENKSVQELEQYAVNKAQETTTSVNNCLRIAENIREDATKTLDMLHQQGDQIHRTHVMAADMDKDLSKVCVVLFFIENVFVNWGCYFIIHIPILVKWQGEKLLNSLGGMFSKTWKPKKTKSIDGPKSTPGMYVCLTF